MSSSPDSEVAEELKDKGSVGRVTPAMRQFFDAKEQYPDCIIFLRMGDFYETFYEDAEVCARELDITLTSRGKMADGEDIPLAGVPYHALETYLSRMISKGYKVAICEQIEDPKKTKGIYKRSVVRVVTPGTLIDAALLNSEVARYLMAVSPDRKRRRIGLAFLDISTGDFQVAEVQLQKGFDAVKSEIARFRPTECVIPSGQDPDFIWLIRQLIPLLSVQDPEIFSQSAACSLLCRQFKRSSLDGYCCSDLPAALSAAGAALAYAQKTQFDQLVHIRSFSSLNAADHLILDAVTLRNLEIIQNIRDRTDEGSLVTTIDFCLTPMGRRCIRQRALSPLRSVEAINHRLDAVEFFVKYTTIRQEVRLLLNRFADLERIAGRVSYGNVSPRDLVSLSSATDTALVIRRLFEGAEVPSELEKACLRITDLTEIAELIRRAIVDEPPSIIRKGGVIRDGYHPELDKIRFISRDGRQWIADLELQEKERTKIKSLKIRYNAVFGYYIEVTKNNLSMVPTDYERRQTTANGERFTIPALKEVESQIATADERLLSLEEELFKALIESVREHVSDLQEISRAAAEIDTFASLAEVALKYRYTRPILALEPEFLIREGRHPVVEVSLSGSFVPNDAELSAGRDQIDIITGANMAGKSTYMRSIALIVVMAQMGSYVPATYAKIGLVDRIFTRVGAFDDLASGQSTFMVEMLELATILTGATEQSLVILDEIGRGTSTLDGYCIAKAVIEHLHGKKSMGPRTLFATHFHEIVGIEQDLKRVRNCHFAVKETDNEVVFLRRLVPGATDRSYGIHVARLAGVPNQVIERADELMKKILRGEETPGGGVKRYTQMILLDGPAAQGPDPLMEEITGLDLDTMTPVQALTFLVDLKSRVKERSR